MTSGPYLRLTMASDQLREPELRQPGTQLAVPAPKRSANRLAGVRHVALRVDYGMVGHGLATREVDGRVTELGYWGFSSDILRRLRRLNELYDRQINWDDPTDPSWRISERDRNEFNALLPFVVSELQIALGDRW